jgi:deoxyribodipyrimidine photo-lyase
MLIHPEFPPTLEAAHARMAAVQVHDYARTRQSLHGAVTQLSPYITHGYLSVPDVARAMVARFRIGVQHRLIHELGWREYAQHLYVHLGESLGQQALHPGPLQEGDFKAELPLDVRHAATGIAAIDLAVSMLYSCGYLHHQARLWLASYIVHVRKIDWRVAAQWMQGHLLDGDVASNWLNWQRVAGLAGDPPWVFNAETVARHAPSDWHSRGSMIDKPIEMMEIMAHNAASFTISEELKRIPWAMSEPELLHRPPALLDWQSPDPQAWAGRDVWLVHPWSLAALPSDLPSGVVAVGLWCEEWMQAMPWSFKRWMFVAQRMGALAPVCAFGSATDWQTALSQASSVACWDHPRLPAWTGLAVQRRSAPRLFKNLDEPCLSFTAWWQQVSSGVRHFRHLAA